MKRTIILFLFLFLSKFTFSQNGGQFNENNVIHVRLLGYSDGNYIFTVKNKQSCIATIRTKADTDPAVDYVVNPNDSVWIYIPRPPLTQIKFRAKAETSCVNNPDMGWLEITDLLGVLSLNENNLIKPIRSSSKHNVSLVGGVLKSNFGQFSDKQTIIIYDGYGRILFRHTNMVFKQSDINLNKFFVKGLNVVCVYVDNKTYDYHVFRIIN